MGKQPAGDLAPYCVLLGHTGVLLIPAMWTVQEEPDFTQIKKRPFWILNIDYVVDTHVLVHVLKIFKRQKKISPKGDSSLIF